MTQPVVLYVATETDPPALTADVLSDASLSVRHVDSEAEAVVACGREPVDCVVADTAAIADPQPFVEALRFRSPSVSVLWLSEGPVEAVADTLEAGTTDYVHNWADADLATLVAHRIRSLCGGEPGGSTEQYEREQYETILESVRDGVCLLDADFEFVLVNEAFAELTGYSAAELVGSDASLITDPADLAATDDCRRTLFDGDSDAAMLAGEITTAAGERLPIEAWMTPITLADGEPGTISVVRDVSFRTATEAMFTVLYEAAHDLLSARSEGEIADIGIEAAASALGFEDAIVFSYDESTNAFRPMAHTPGAECHFPGLPPIYASDTSLSGRAFFESETIVTTDMSELPEVYDPETPYRRAVFTPIGEHGVLFVGDTEAGATAEQTRTVAELLGASLAAAFGRLASEQRSEATRAALADRTTELASISHTNELLDALLDELLDASTREQIDATICSVLADFEQYRLAWIGTAEGRTDAIVPRAVAGHDEGYLDWLATHATTRGQSTLEEPAVCVLETKVPVSVDRIAADWQTAPWRKEALSRGYQSALSVPLTYDGISYGVLSIYADSQHGFDAYSQTALAEFGRLVAYVIECTETKRGLLADHHTEIELDVVDGDDPLFELAGRLGATLRFEGIVPQRGDQSLLYFRASGLSVSAVETAAAELSAVDSLRAVTQQPEATLFEATVSGPLLAATVVDCGAIPTRIETDGDRHEVAVTIPQTTDVRTVIDRIKTVYPSTTVVSRRDCDREIRTQETFRMQLLDRLTARQQETLRAAYFARYFESPRGSTGTELGEALGISQPTFTYHLRAALKTLLTTLFEVEPDDALDI